MKKLLQISLWLIVLLLLLLLFFIFNNKDKDIMQNSDIENIVESWSQFQDFDNKIQSDKTKINSWDLDTLQDVDRP